MKLDLADPVTFGDGTPHEALAELRRTTPVVWQEMAGEPGFWAVLRHADVVTVARQPELFSANVGGVLLEDLPPARLRLTQAMLLAMDPPRHTERRRPLAPPFTARAVSQLEVSIRQLCRDIVARIVEVGTADVVAEVATLPTEVIGELVGLPPAERPAVHELAERIMRGDQRHGDPFEEMAEHAVAHAARRRRAAERGNDLTSVVLGADGAGMSDAEFAGFFVQLVTAGNDTTVTMLSSAVLALAQHPEQFARLRADPSLAPSAVEEVLRWANPLHYFRRTATADAVLAGVPIAEGAKVAMYYTSANRDEDVFADPHRFDVTRSPNPHLAFGIGPHFCLGAHLARLEGRAFLEELAAVTAELAVDGLVVRQRSTINNSLRSLPVRASPV